MKREISMMKTIRSFSVLFACLFATDRHAHGLESKQKPQV